MAVDFLSFYSIFFLLDVADCLSSIGFALGLDLASFEDGLGFLPLIVAY
jgi:hypothetical protein